MLGGRTVAALVWRHKRRAWFDLSTWRNYGGKLQFPMFSQGKCPLLPNVALRVRGGNDRLWGVNSAARFHQSNAQALGLRKRRLCYPASSLRIREHR